ncbi:peptidylprolyl isomerase [Amycolatopsis sp. NPDC049253]|uniref:peptidylprolyl isomerase n=1 Tax=Amycolatopsis sp. NPDC049253 TaxID=3155274 RepID=UPI003417EA25
MKRLLVTTLAIGALCAAFTPAAQATQAAAPTTTHGACQYTETPDEPAARPVPLPPDPRHTPDRGKVDVPVITNQGLLPLKLDRAEAPCTVQSFLHLARHGFFNNTTCHRLTAYPTLQVLQCGDPTATGEGGPGYSFRDELPTDLPPSTTNPSGPGRIYSRGLVAMANAGPNTNGSQFFLVYGDSTLRPDYTVFGTVGPLGLRTLDRVAAGGIEPNEDGTAVDGTPVRKTDLELVLPLGL